STVEHYNWTNGVNGVGVEHLKIINGGHTWPGSALPNSNDGITNYDINASLEIWKFFSKYDINGLISPTAIVSEHNLNKQLIQVIDIWGRESKGLKNQPLIYIYDDGSVEQKIILE
ncbi:MAG: hypothetical protein VXX18_00170, partial [Bacteroidota bacterium]|nr:hypothetical protein [Bacteroidota bacterium]